MATERDILLRIIAGDPAGLSGLFVRHGALFHECLVRFRGKADAEGVNDLVRIVDTLVADLQKGRFDDVVETFYDWVAREVWTQFISIRLEEAGGDHLEPGKLFLCSDRLSMAALPETERREAELHLEQCPLCKELIEQCQEVPVQVRHAGAAFPREFRPILDRTIELARKSH